MSSLVGFSTGGGNFSNVRFIRENGSLAGSLLQETEVGVLNVSYGSSKERQAKKKAADLD